MPAKKPNDKNTKAEILQAYEELAKEKVEIKSQLERLQKSTNSVNSSVTKDEPKVENKPTIMNQASNVQQKMNSTIESLVKIQLGFGSAASELSEQLTTRASKLETISQSLETESQELKQLHNLEVSEETLDNLLET